MLSFYAGRAPAVALLMWALEGHVLDIRPQNLWVRPHEGHGIAAVAVRSADFLPGGLATLYDVVLRQHLLPLSEELHRRTRAGLRQLHGGVAAGCAMSFCAATREEVTLDPRFLLDRWRTFVAKGPGRTRATRRRRDRRREARLPPQHLLSLLLQRSRQRHALRLLLPDTP
jgi:hypothetical protein